MAWWVEAKKAERLVNSGLWLYTGRSEWRGYGQGVCGYVYYELIPNH